MDRSETVTLLNDMSLLAPATLVDPRIRWDAVGPLGARATFTNEGHTVSATLEFDGTGALVNFRSDDRDRTADGLVYERARWSTPITMYRNIGGRMLPVRAEDRWALPGGEFTYARFDIVDVAYNVRAK